MSKISSFYILLLSIFIFSCAVGRKEDPWVDYEIKYVGSEKELTEFVMGLTENDFEYRVLNHKEGTIEIQYRK